MAAGSPVLAATAGTLVRVADDGRPHGDPAYPHHDGSLTPRQRGSPSAGLAAPALPASPGLVVASAGGGGGEAGGGGVTAGGVAGGIERWRLIILTSAMLGVQCCYSVQINRGSATLQLLGMDENKVSLAWLAGPLSGLLVQPLVGVASDACRSPLGRRRPFLIAGAILTSLSLTLFANADWLGARLAGVSASAAAAAAAAGDSVGVAAAAAAEAAGRKLAVVLAVVAFFLLDFSIQAIQAPLRALVTDVASEGQQPLGNAYIGLMTGCGNLVGSFLSSRNLSKLFPVFRTDVQALFAAAAFILCLTVGLCVTYVREKPTSSTERGGYERAPSERSMADGPPAHLTRFGTGSDDESIGDSDGGVNVNGDTPPWRGSPVYADEDSGGQQRVGGGFAASDSGGGNESMLTMLLAAPRPFWRVFAVQLFTWIGFFTLFVFVNTWVGRNIYLGSSSAAEGSDARRLFEAGVRLGGLGNCLTAFVTVVYSPMITSLLERYGTCRTYAFSQFVEALCLFAAYFIRGTPGQEHPSWLLKTATLVSMGAFGVVWATTMAVPWALVGAALNRRYPGRVGLFTTLFNVSQSFPQLFVSLGSPWILDKVGGDVSVVMALGGLFALVGGALIFLLRVDLFDDDVDERAVYELEDTVRDEREERQEPMY
ncbi:hypothetical protein MMPV_000370 [Pyropia vietnamensis]